MQSASSLIEKINVLVWVSLLFEVRSDAYLNRIYTEVLLLPAYTHIKLLHS